MPLLAIATLGLLCAFAGGGVGAGLALAGGLEPSMAVVLSLPAAAAASYFGWRVTPVEKVQGPHRRTA
ncbi:hypothetical protein [Rhodovibrio salinarum]|uniref:Uncharacterized protein n=1 Tax=Rhodovibrio salinarum TaxID=1087 RepID=A0A934QFA4_9PROT|nr:hypothetical protein [Rhodovibrio salinarum]MBK1696008.1 hypothetical protein [Rhodovibrio salinarum]